MSRPIKLTPEVHERICALVRAGNFRETASAAAGIDARTLRNWLRRGAEGEEPFATFSTDLDEAETVAEARNVAIIGAAAKDDWRAAAWWLERKASARWAKTVVSNVVTTETPTVHVVLTDSHAAPECAAIARVSGDTAE